MLGERNGMSAGKGCRSGRGGPSRTAGWRRGGPRASGAGRAGPPRRARPRVAVRAVGELVTAEDRQRRERRAEPERVGGEEEVLHGGKDGRVDGRGEGETGVAADDDQDRSRRRCRPWRHDRRRAGKRGRGVPPRRPGRRLARARAPSVRRWSGAIAGSRTTTKTKGWLFSALGAWVAAVRMRATVSSSTSSGRKERAARCVWTTSKKSGTGAEAVASVLPDDRCGIRPRPAREVVPSRWTGRPDRAGGWIGRGRGDFATVSAASARGPVPAMTTWSGRGGGGQEAEGGRRRRIARRTAQGDHRAADRSSPRSSSSEDPCSISPTRVLSSSPIYHNPGAAKQAGFDNIPAPPTWPFAMEFSGKFDEIQPPDAPIGRAPRARRSAR